MRKEKKLVEEIIEGAQKGWKNPQSINQSSMEIAQKWGFEIEAVKKRLVILIALIFA